MGTCLGYSNASYVSAWLGIFHRQRASMLTCLKFLFYIDFEMPESATASVRHHIIIFIFKTPECTTVLVQRYNLYISKRPSNVVSPHYACVPYTLLLSPERAAAPTLQHVWR